MNRKRLYAMVVAPVAAAVAITGAVIAAQPASAASRDEFCRYTQVLSANFDFLDGNGDGLIGWGTIVEYAYSPADTQGAYAYFYANDTSGFPYIETAGYAPGNSPDGLASWNDINQAFNKQCL